MDFRQSDAFAKYLEASGWITDRLSDGTYVYILNLPFLGSFLRIPRPKPPILFSEINKIAKKYHAFAIKIEPDAESSDLNLTYQLKQNGYKFDNWSIEPTKTSVIDLNQSEDRLFKNLHTTWKRYTRFAKRNGCLVSQSDNIELFNKLWQQNARNKGYLVEKPSQTKVLFENFYNKQQATILTAYFKNDPIASAFLIFFGKTAHLWHLAYTGQLPHLKPLYLLVWESIVFAKNKGMSRFDFEGVEDDRFPYSKTTQASFFKRGFGGREIIYPGSYIYFLNLLATPIYKIMSLINPALFRMFVKSKP